MFDWLYRRIADGVLRNFDLSELLNDDENQKLMFQFLDHVYDRYRDKVLASFMKGQQVVEGTGVGMPNVLNKRGELNLKGLVPMFIGNFLKNRDQPQGSNRLP